ncbi:ABC transporter ATP-binding protein [Paenibacillus sp. GCM10012307]|uniref:ATP-binding cassette domain-containing protein n=1 Tax=Paenibacillus roseus TaxID=2798579 RepID=A0A934IYQ3_9BACL|nr:oligopeptide/dipeptide ABC transporter ATP-binding protein [Paenibacillus roseus]MBJ6360119.1 ATP-binding cassette domain-containing protein [Paenibacillus roseus]
MAIQLEPQRQPLVEIDQLQMHYPLGSIWGSKQTLKAVDGISLHIRKGETLGLVGESGCGKSTVGQLTARLLEPTGGRLFYKGEDLQKLRSGRDNQLRKQIQYVFQDPYTSMNPKHIIAALLEEPLRIHRIGTRPERKAKVRDMLKQIGLNESYEFRYIHELSGGQRQRIGIARALMLQPEFLILDEPVSALDVSVQSQILNLLKDLQQQFSLTYLFISHDLNVVHYMSDRVAVMYLGKIVELADVNDLYTSPLHPYTRALVSAIPAKHRGQRQERIRLQGEIPSASATPSGCAFHTRCPFAVERCRRETPTLRLIRPGRRVSCHLHE